MTSNSSTEKTKVPNLKHSILLLGLAFVLQIILMVILGSVVGIIIGIILRIQDYAPEEIQQLSQQLIEQNMHYMTIVTIIISSLILVFIGLKLKGITWEQLVLKNREIITRKRLGILVIPTLSLPLVSGNLVDFIWHIFNLSDAGIEELAFSLSGVPGFILGLGIAPVFEELIFRGLILDGLKENYSDKLALILSAVLFAIYHFNWFQLLPTFIVGLFIGYIYLKTESVLLCIYTHFIYNLMPLISNQIYGEEALQIGNVEFTTYIFFFLGLIIFAIGIKLFKRSLNDYKSKLGQ